MGFRLSSDFKLRREVRPDKDIAELFGISTENSYHASMIENQFFHYIINHKLGGLEEFRLDETLAGLSGFDVGQVCKYDTFLKSIEDRFVWM